MRILNYGLNLISGGISRLFVKSKVLPEKPLEQFELNPKNPTFYIVRLNSRFDLAALARVCKRNGLPDPTEQQVLGDQALDRFIGIKNPPPLFGNKEKPTNALDQGKQIIETDLPAYRID